MMFLSMMSLAEAEELRSGRRRRDGRNRREQNEAHWARWPSTGRVHKGVAWWSAATTWQRRSGLNTMRPGPRRRVQEDPDHPELLVLPRSRDVVVLVQYACEVAVARHGDQRVHVLRQQLAPHDHRVSATQLPELLEQTFTPRKRNHTPEAEQGRGLQSNTWTTVVYLCTRTVEVEGAMDGEDAGVAADVA
jgi:hypothetical protein